MTDEARRIAGDMISSVKPVIDPMKALTWLPETSLRWKLEPGRAPNINPEKTLEQMWINVKTGEREWRPVPTVQGGAGPPTIGEDTLEITPEMTQAGVIALESFRESFPDVPLVQAVYKAMQAKAPTVLDGAPMPEASGARKGSDL